MTSPGFLALHTICMLMTLTFVLGSQSPSSRLMLQTADATAMPGFLKGQNEAPKLPPQTCGVLIAVILVTGNSILPTAQSSRTLFFLPSNPILNPLGLPSKYTHNLTAFHPFTGYCSALTSHHFLPGLLQWPATQAPRFSPCPLQFTHNTATTANEILSQIMLFVCSKSANYFSSHTE